MPYRSCVIPPRSPVSSSSAICARIVPVLAIAAAITGCSRPVTESIIPALPPLTEPAQTTRFATVQQSLERQPSGSPIAWNSPDGLSHGLVVPLGTVRSSLYGWCRDYEERIQTGGHLYPLVGVACRGTGPEWLVLDVKPVGTS